MSWNPDWCLVCWGESPIVGREKKNKFKVKLFTLNAVTELRLWAFERTGLFNRLRRQYQEWILDVDEFMDENIADCADEYFVSKASLSDGIDWKDSPRTCTWATRIFFLGGQTNFFLLVSVSHRSVCAQPERHVLSSPLSCQMSFYTVERFFRGFSLIFGLIFIKY